MFLRRNFSYLEEASSAGEGWAFRFGMAAECNIPSLINYIFKEFPNTEMNTTRGRRFKSPLCVACGLGNNEAVLALISHGTDVNYDPGRGPALLHAVHRRSRCYWSAIRTLMLWTPEIPIYYILRLGIITSRPFDLSLV